MIAAYPATAPVRSTEPTEAQEPLSVSEARRQVGLAASNVSHDPDLARFIVAARRKVEHDARVVCYTGTHIWRFTDWPAGDFFEFPIRPVTSVTSITSIAPDGDTDTFDSGDYSLDTNGIIPIVKLAYGEYWPSLRGTINGITVTLVAGYSSVANIPRDILDAVILDLKRRWKLHLGEDAGPYQRAYDDQIELLGHPVYR